MNKQIEFSEIKDFAVWVKKNYGYNINGGLFSHSLQYSLKLEILKKFAIEVRKIYIIIEPYKNKNSELGWNVSWCGLKTFNDTYKSFMPTIMYVDCDSPEDALEKGLLNALKL